MESCPHCSSVEVISWGRDAAGRPRRRCGSCRRTFGRRTGTVAARMRHEGLWGRATRPVLSVRKAAAECGIAPSTVMRWRSRGLADHAKPTAVDLFCGAGGSALGLASHLDVVRGFDSSHAAVDVYNANLGHGAEVIDLADVPAAVAAISRLAPTIVWGSPPCQDFSKANSGPCDTGSRAKLTVAFAEIVASCRPAAFVMENVDRAQHAAEWSEAREILRAAGYGITERVVCASRVGVPQLRRRLIAWGLLGGVDDGLGALADSRLADQPLSVAEALPHLPVAWYRHPRNRRTRGIYSASEPSPAITGTNRPIPSGYHRRHNDSADPADVRCLTPEERAAIQGFPASWKWIGSRTAIEAMVGNAVPPALAAWAASILIDGMALMGLEQGH